MVSQAGTRVYRLNPTQSASSGLIGYRLRSFVHVSESDLKQADLAQ